jgi:hypothetical protein
MKVLVEGDVVDLGQLDEGTGVDWARVDKVGTEDYWSFL